MDVDDDTFCSGVLSNVGSSDEDDSDVREISNEEVRNVRKTLKLKFLFFFIYFHRW